ncbi:MAG: CAAX prenyl protease-related protein [Planctomycetota bacterium]|nr:MAG: CAAX prenyl protease-related protein [Planctomycetota bacterium]
MSAPPPATNPKTTAHVAPLMVFMGFLMLLEGLRAIGFTSTEDSSAWWRRQPELWLYPLQTVVSLQVLLMSWKHYDFRPFCGIGWAIGAGILGIAVWIAPGFLFVQFKMALGPLSYLGFSPRTDGFNPVLITQNQAFWYWFIVVLRFLRLVIVVPLVEEIFWRGFLMRFLCDIDGDYWKVPFGKFHWLSLVVVTAMFVMAHAPVDYVAAAVFGILMYGVAVKTKSLTACIVMHATANFILGLYVLSTQQWGYW